MKITVTRSVIVALCSLVLLLSSRDAPGAERPWKAGFGAIEISPAEPVWLAGYAARNRPSEGISHPIYAKAMALEDPRGNKWILITSDILGFTPPLAEPIANRIQKKYKVRRDQVMFTSSHTHSAPVVREYMVFAYGLSAEQEAAIERYSKQLDEKVFKAVEQAMKNRTSARLSFGRGKAGFLINRRVSTPRGYTINVNPDGPVDPEVPVLRVESTAGKLLGVLFGFACHNTTLGGDYYKVDGDYAGYAQAELERSFPQARALFVAGTAGDANPNPRGKLEHAQQYGKELADAVKAVFAQPMQPISGNLGTAMEYVSLPFAPPPTKTEFEARLAESDRGRQRHARRMLDVIARDGKLPADYPYPIQVARFGDSMAMVALGGEVVVDYSIRLKKELTNPPIFLIAYANDVMGYIPSVRILKEGGYEGGGSMIFYGRPGPWAEEVEELIVRKVHDLVGRARPTR